MITNKGKINFQSYVHATKNYILFETEATDEEINYNWSWNPLKAISPRAGAAVTHPSNLADYTSRPNPAVQLIKENDYNFSVQELVAGLSYVVAWKEIKTDSKRRIVITVSQEKTSAVAIAVAKQTIDECLNTPVATLENTHKQWWHDYYPMSFISFPESKFESFYWAQIYKFACLTRPDKFIVDLQGPWARDNTPWPAIWMNLNTQLSYSWLFAGNRSDFSKPLWKAFNDNIVNLQNNVHNTEWRSEAIVMGRSTSYHLKSFLSPTSAESNQYEVGNMTWLLFYYWQYCIYNNRIEELKDKFFPLLKKSIAYYSFIRTKGADGKYHLPLTASPEYLPAEDCNYDLACLRWGLETLLDINRKYNLNDNKEAHWEDFLNNLIDYPVDASRGYMIGKGVNLTSSHRHYSHLMMIYPFYTIHWEQEANQSLIAKSINNWQSQTGALQGYSFTGSSAMYSSMGDGTRAVKQLQSLLEKYIQPNTLYKESGPVIETPLAAVASLHDLYLQSWGGKIRLFHGVPSNWAEASFINLRAEGAFVVSASRANGKTVFVQIESEKGGVCRLQTGMSLNNLQLIKLGAGSSDFTTLDSETGLIEFDTAAGDVFQITVSNLPQVLPAALPHSPAEATPYGVNSGPDISLLGMTLPSEIQITVQNPIASLSPEFIPQGAVKTNLTWQSSNENVVKVKNGILTPCSRGEAIVSATTADGEHTAQCRVNVMDDFQAYERVSLADTYVRNGSYGNDNYSTESLVVIKKDDAGYDRSGYFKFSIADLDKTSSGLVNTKVAVNVNVSSSGLTANTAEIYFYAVPTTSWMEKTISFNNRPANGVLLQQIPGFVAPSFFDPQKYMLIDLTQYALNEYAKGNKEISLSVTQSQRASGGAGTVNLASKENLDFNLHPTLTVLKYGVNTAIERLKDESVQVFPLIAREWVYVKSDFSAPLEIRNVN